VTDFANPIQRKAAFDFAAFWDDCVRRDPNNRLDAQKDLSFWRHYAALYDQRAGAPGSAARTLRLIRQHLRPTDTLLDVGAGTGRFAIPLSHYVRQVTALDHSPDMLDILTRKASVWNVENIQTVRADWSDYSPEPHDIVLAAWSLYRQPRLLDALRKLVEAARRRLFIVAEVKSWPPHHRIAAQIWPERCADERDVPMHLSYLGALWQLGAHADLRIVREKRLFIADTPTGLAALLAPSDASAVEIGRFAEQLTPHMRHSQHGCLYHTVEPVAVILWRADEWDERVPASSD